MTLDHETTTAETNRRTPCFSKASMTLEQFVHRPPVVRPGGALVVVLHGCTQTAEGYARDAGWLELADREGFVVLAPGQTRAGNANLCFNWFTRQHGGEQGEEVLAILAMIDALIESDGLDRSRVYVTGLSAGGAMAFALLMHHPQVFAGCGVIAGLPADSARSTVEALALMRGQASRPESARSARVSLAPGQAPLLSIWHGTADHIVAPVNADRIADQWIDRAGLEPEPDRTDRDGTRHRQSWTGPSGSPVLEINRLTGFGHATPLATHGPHGIGRTAPHLVECGHSSTRELAVFWGLCDATADAPLWISDTPKPKPNFTARCPGPRSSPRPTGLRDDVMSHLDGRTPDEVRDLIDRTLRQAGL